LFIDPSGLNMSDGTLPGGIPYRESIASPLLANGSEVHAGNANVVIDMMATPINSLLDDISGFSPNHGLASSPANRVFGTSMFHELTPGASAPSKPAHILAENTGSPFAGPRRRVIHGMGRSTNQEGISITGTAAPPGRQIS
jgi:hypothetical protein